MRGYAGIGIYHPRKQLNVGGLLRSAHAFGADLVYTIGQKYERQASDVSKASRHVPLIHFQTFEEFRQALPRESTLIGVELDPAAVPLGRFVHPERAIYLLGCEATGIPESVRRACRVLVEVEGAQLCLNVATAGSIVLWHRRETAARRTLAAVG